jgi:nicotinamide phosphoribosyltransferase
MLRTGISSRFRSHSSKSPNLLLLSDVYKMGHMEQYVPNCNKVYSYLQARSDKTFKESVFFGLQYYLKEYLSKPITHDHVNEFIHTRNAILGSTSPEIENKMRRLADIGYFPLEIKAIPEGSVIPVKNVLMTMTNTHPEFYWTVGFVESLLLKIWYPISVATTSYHYRKIVNQYFHETVDDVLMGLKPFMVHDFGYRGDASEEGFKISGLAHLLSFTGSDTVPAHKFSMDYYGGFASDIMKSVPASEHSVMCSFGKENEIDAFKHMLKLYPTGPVSIVSDTYSIWNVLTQFAQELKPLILQRDGVTVFRPDSGDQMKIICGDPDADPQSPEGKGCLKLLEETFGSNVNTKGYKQLNPKVSLIYGDGIYLQKYENILQKMKEMNYASSNLIIGVGGILRNHTRDTLGFAMKATKIEVNGVEKTIFKDPITDQKKKSHRGYLCLIKDEKGNYQTLDEVTREQEKEGLLLPVFRDGKLLTDYTIYDIRERIEKSLNK